MDKTFTFAKADFAHFLADLKNFGKVHAPVPVSDQSYAFKPIAHESEIAFEALRTILPPKKFFYPQRETLIEYSGNEVREVHPAPEPIVLFGVHPCDLAGLKILDTIFTAAPGDTHYINRRQHCLIVGTGCIPDKHCFCKSMGTDKVEEGYDVFLTDIGDAYFVQIHTQLGWSVLSEAGYLKLVEHSDVDAYNEFWTVREQSFQIGFNGSNLRALMDIQSEHPVWEELANRCLSCGNCVPVCPTCYCFDIVDIASLDGQSGERRREWDACQIVSFGKVAGGHNFRPGPIDRLKFWYRHKLHGFDDPYGFKTCVGCGRCTVSCPAGIDDIVGVVLTIQGQEVKLQHQQEHDKRKESK